MRLEFNPKVASDIGQIMAHLEQVATAKLANDFYEELRHYMVAASERPTSFAVREQEVRRVNLRRFPYHFCFG